MNKVLEITTADGLKIKGELLATRSEFYFTVWQVTEISTGRTFEDIDAANAELDLAMDAESIAREAAVEAGIDYVELCDMAWHFNSRADRENRM